MMRREYLQLASCIYVLYARVRFTDRGLAEDAMQMINNFGGGGSINTVCSSARGLSDNVKSGCLLCLNIQH